MAAGNPLAARLADRISGLRFDTLPPDVVQRAKQCLLDQVGIQLRGTTLPQVAPAIHMALDGGRLAEATLPLPSRGLRTATSAYACAALGHSCEYDDSHLDCGHPGVCVIPVVIALGEELGASGRDLVAAIVAGYEAMVIAIRPIHRQMLTIGWHGTKVGGVFGAAAAAASLLHLSVSEMANAFAIAGSDASGTMEYDQSGGEVKRLHPAMAARAGLEAALLAKQGMTGPLTIFEGKRGIYRLFGNGDEPETEGTWQTEFHIRNLIFKLYPAVGNHHAPLDGLRTLMAEHDFGASDVRQIVVSMAPWAVEHGGATRAPEDAISAQFNLGFSFAMRLLEQSNALDLYLDPQRWSDPDVASVARKIQVVPIAASAGDPGLSAEVEVVLDDGRRVRRHQATFRGNADDPASDAELEEKFRQLTNGLLPRAHADQLLKTVRELDKLTSVRDLTALLVG